MTTVATKGPAGAPAEPRYEFSYGKGKLPFLIALLWIGFVAWFFWFVIEYQLPAFKTSFPTTAETSAPAPK